eukprot:5285484-Pyramimonas_sp.AAC.1
MAPVAPAAGWSPDASRYSCTRTISQRSTAGCRTIRSCRCYARCRISSLGARSCRRCICHNGACRAAPAVSVESKVSL